MALRGLVSDGLTSIDAIARTLQLWSRALALTLTFPATDDRGKELKDIKLVVGANSIPHGLGALPRGWLVLRMQGAASAIYEESATSKDLVLNSSAACTMNLWVW